MATKALVTGGAGFIGSHLVEALVSDGYEVRVLDSLVKGRLTTIQPLVEEGRVQFIEGDIRSRDMVNRAVRGVDYIFHTAGIHIQRSVESPEDMIEVNIRGAYNVFNSALEHGVRRVVFSSSSSIYGDPKKLPMSEVDPPAPVEPYGASKWMCEQLLAHLGRQGLQYNALRYFNVYGERQATHAFYTTVINNFVKRLLDGKPPIIDGAGTQSMDFTHVSDVVQANLLATASASYNEVFNVGTGVSTTVMDLARILIAALGAEVKPEFSGRPTLVSRRQADISKAKAFLDFEPRMEVTNGLTQVARAIAAHPEGY